MYLIFILLGILCCGYFLAIAVWIGIGNNFYFVWPILGICLFVFAALLRKGIWSNFFPLWFRRLFLLAVLAGSVLVIFVESFIVSGFFMEAPKDLDYVIVLGAKVNADGPSRALKYRLDEAIAYLTENPDTKVIVSGGQGTDEQTSEAWGMQEYLLGKGIKAERIVLEEQSTDTVQNLAYSAEFLDKEQDRVGIVTNNFHLFRAVRIAKKAGYRQVYGIVAKGEPFTQCNNMMREFFGVVRDFMAGNM